MTDFERTIKRAMTREKFLEIREQFYGDGINICKYKYGNIASWFTWNRDKNGDVADLPHTILSDGKNLWDDRIDIWEKDQPPAFSSKLTVDIVFLGFSLSGDGGRSLPWGNNLYFQNARGVRRVAQTFAGTAAEGAYFTDIIKPDKRFLGDGKGPVSPGALLDKALAQSETLKEHIDIFIEELAFIGAEKPLLVVFGKKAEKIIQKEIKTRFRQNFRDIVYTMSYAAYPKDGDAGYKEIVRKDLARYITIPGGVS